MATIAEIAGQVGSATVEVRGTTVNLSAVCAADIVVLRRCFPRPMPPMAPDPSRGTGAPFVPDHADERYNVRLNEWNQRVIAAEVAMGLRLVTASGRKQSRVDAEFRVWAEEAVGELLETFTTPELRRLSEALDRASGVDMEERAVKN